MKEIFGTVTDRIIEDTIVYGATDGQVVVSAGVQLIVQGATASSVLIEEGASVTVNGAVVGKVINHGRLTVNGLVLGDVRDLGAGVTQVNVPHGKVHIHEIQPHPRAAGARVLNESLAGVTIDRDLVLNGSASNLTIDEGVFVQINGSISGDVLVAAGAEVRIHGSVDARVRNRGRVDVYGSMSGSIVDEAGGSSEIHEGETLDLAG